MVSQDHPEGVAEIVRWYPDKEAPSILVVGDAHFTPHCDFERAAWVGEIIMDRRPDIVITMGDWYDMHSLNAYEKHGSKSMEGVNISDDIRAGDAAFDTMFTPVWDHNQSRRAINKKTYQPDFIFLHGNHEERLDRFIQDFPKFEKAFVYGAEERSDLVVPYRHYVDIGGVLFTHIPHNKARPISSVYGARKVLQAMDKSVVWGHTHMLDFATSTRIGGDQIYGLNVGCLFDDDPHYMDGLVKDYWRGVVLLSNVTNGKFDFETISYRSA